MKRLVILLSAATLFVVLFSASSVNAFSNSFNNQNFNGRLNKINEPILINFNHNNPFNRGFNTHHKFCKFSCDPNFGHKVTAPNYSDYTNYNDYSSYNGYDNYDAYSNYASYDEYNSYSNYSGYDNYGSYDNYNSYAGYDSYDSYEAYDFESVE